LCCNSLTCLQPQISHYPAFDISTAFLYSSGSFSGLINHLSGARHYINDNGGINGEDVRLGDENIEVLSASAGGLDPGGWGIDNIANDTQNDVQTGDSDGSDGSGGCGGDACFISTLAD
jgi:hypothetical protein